MRLKGRWRVAGLDLSLTCSGVAGPTGRPARIITGKLRGPERLVYIHDRVLDAVSPADLVVIEAYAFNQKASRSMLVPLAELGGVIRAGLWRAGLPYFDISPTTLKVYATGAGHADKATMVAAAQELLGYGGDDDNEADALWLRALGLALMGTPAVDLPRAHERALDALTGRNPTMGRAAVAVRDVKVAEGRL